MAEERSDYLGEDFRLPRSRNPNWFAKTPAWKFPETSISAPPEAIQFAHPIYRDWPKYEIAHQNPHTFGGLIIYPPHLFCGGRGRQLISQTRLQSLLCVMPKSRKGLSSEVGP